MPRYLCGFGTMGWRFWICLLIGVLHSSSLGLAQTNSNDDAIALIALASNWKSLPFSWSGNDPCGSGWVGIKCKNGRVISLQLESLGLIGTLSGDIGSLTELQVLDLSYNVNLTGNLPQSIGKLTKLQIWQLVGCGFSGQIPDLSSLQQLSFLSLTSNQFSGEIPASIGTLSNLYWLDLSNNMLTGKIPVSNWSTPGLDNLENIKHLHFGNNMLTGTIPPQLFHSDSKLIHVLFDNNRLSGPIPDTMGLVQSLEAVRFDRNLLSNPVPSNINNLTRLTDLYLSHNRLSGPLPNLTGMNALNYLNLSNNNFDPSDVPPWFSTLNSLSTLVLEYLRIRGELSPSLFIHPQLQTVCLRNNNFNGTLTITSYGKQLHYIDLQNNAIENFTSGVGTFSGELILVGTPYCEHYQPSSYCTVMQQSTSSYSTPVNCGNLLCPSDLNLSPTCKCAYPLIGTFYFRTISFSNLANLSYFQALEAKLMDTFKSENLPVDYVYLHNISFDQNKYLVVGSRFFPSIGDRFDPSDVISISFLLSNQTFQPPSGFGQFYFISLSYTAFPATQSSKLNKLPVIIGASAAGLVVLLIITGLAVFAIQQKKKAARAIERSQPFASWDPSKGIGASPQLKGARWFSFDELKKCTNSFSQSNDIGSGGFGKVYKGILPTGQLVAIKRAQQDSMQGGNEFRTEIELLSRVHHKNLVSLVGFCFDQGEQMLVYEHVPNGSLRDSLSGKSGVHLDWKKRLRVAVGAARGLAYLHELANPPIIHRDVKSANILLDERLNAKVSDFGLSKPMGNDEKDHMTTQVKGTMGYLDPEYYMTQQLTEKSDVYSFGVLMLELFTGKKPIERRKYIVREVKLKMNKSESLYGLHQILDPALRSSSSEASCEKFVDLAMKCVEDLGTARPTMSEVVKQIEGILQLEGLNPNANSISTSYEETSTSDALHPYNEDAFASYSTGPPVPR